MYGFFFSRWDVLTISMLYKIYKRDEKNQQHDIECLIVSISPRECSYIYIFFLNQIDITTEQ